ncbi:DUF4153 domain-containing protein [Ochrovirga pacifica]|uniref:DUF4153 domain-containing protein n=1 Tax=Ochrovirga pacifica TaxID=1042376 RepID=UPI0002559207|nr:DUF4153 domain-containing protein [Ochrovirga pacifica]
MKFSFSHVVHRAKTSLFRFPWVIASAFCGVLIALYLVAYQDTLAIELSYINALLTFALGVPLYFCTTIFIEQQQKSNTFNYLTQGFATVLLVGIYLSLPNSLESHNLHISYIRYGIYNAIVHLLVAYVPYLKNKHLNGFWNYNKSLFLRLCTAVLYSLVLYIGISIAYAAVDSLFQVDINSELYFETFIVIIGLFNTWFFVAGVPKNLNALEAVTEYPKGLKIFSQYVLLSLLLLYLVILYAYGFKITLLQSWPKGWITYLVSGVSILGFFTVLLLYPYAKIKENSWIAKFTKVFYILLLPLSIMMILAIQVRVSAYGITIKRYASYTLALWIVLVCVYFLFQKDNIKFIPISLSILLLASSFGTWSMFAVSETSQVDRLEKLLKKQGILTNGKINNEVVWDVSKLPKWEFKNPNHKPKTLPDSIQNQVKSILDYLDDYHGMEKIRPWFTQNLDSLYLVSQEKNKSRFPNEAKIYMQSMGLEYRKIYTRNSSQKYYYYRSKKDRLTKTNGATYLYNFTFHKNTQAQTIHTANTDIGIERTNKSLNIIYHQDTLHIPFKKLTQDMVSKWGLKTQNQLPEKLWIQTLDNKGVKIRCELDYVQLQIENNTTKLQSCGGTLFIYEE